MDRLSKEIWLGPVLGANRERLLAECAEFVARGEAHKFLYLAASHTLLELVTERLLDGENSRGVWGEFPVYLFRGFVRRLLAGAIDTQTGKPLAPRTSIDREELPLRRTLISQILINLASSGKLKALGPLVHRDGCVNSLATLIGEIERAGKSPAEFAEIIENRVSDFGERDSGAVSSRSDAAAASNLSLFALLPEVETAGSLAPRAQVDFDRDIALVYATYHEALDRFALTADDSDQLRALQILRGDQTAGAIKIPWLEQVELLVLDGFFDFTPVQGEMLACLIPAIPNVIVNLNSDEVNAEIFAPFRVTIDQLRSITEFSEEFKPDLIPVTGALSPLRQRLFNSSEPSAANSEPEEAAVAETQNEITLLECSDRDTEVRAIAKEIKRLILLENYTLAEIGLVVRERASYADTLLRVLRDEGIPCNLEQQIEAADVPAVRACLKLFQMLGSENSHALKSSDLADLVKSDYFRLSDPELDALQNQFEDEYAELLELQTNGANGQPENERRVERLRLELGIGRWDADNLENVIAFVGSELRTGDWLARAAKLVAELPQAGETKELLVGSETSDDEDGDSVIEAESERDDPAIVRPPRAEKKRRPSREVHPAAIAWVSLVVQRMDQLIKGLPAGGRPPELRAAIVGLLDALQFHRAAIGPGRRAAEDELAQVTLDRRGLESLRRAFVAAARGIEIAAQILPGKKVQGELKLDTFLGEVIRCLRAQVLRTGIGARDGLRVLEATDVRGLRFRALFVAGLVEGGFPLRASRDWLYSHEERERLQREGLTLEDKSPNVLLKEEHYFYQAACRATDRLYLTRPLALNDGTETVASYYVDELRSAIAPAELKPRRVRLDFDELDLFDSSSSSELAIALVRQSEPHRRPQKASLPREGIEWLLAQAQQRNYLSPSARRRIHIEHERAGTSFGPYDGQITDPDLIRMLAQEFGAQFPHSASGLSLYGNCPYKFFASRVLKLQPRGEAALDLEAIDAGKLLHEVLRRFFDRHRTHSLLRQERNDLHRELAQIADKVFDEHEYVVPPLNPRIWKIDREIRKIILEQVLEYELGMQEKTGPAGGQPTYFEVAFGMKREGTDPISTDQYLELARSGNPASGIAETARIKGQIDRVDVAPSGGLTAYDYKLSKGATLHDMRAGRDVQLALYLAALEQTLLPGRELAGGGYYILKGRTERRNKGLYRLAHSDATGVSKQVDANLPDDEWLRIRREVIERVWQFIDGMRGGNFRVTPSLQRKTCAMCDYAAVCRYDPYRINWKLRHERAIT
ncbi:MAG: ATP-dependent helicase/nuclease subunit [Blastocatellia bacterium]|nr:ATP-dependent helicase/nuclease subunit [Blastocatellia bacterium]